MKTRSFFMVFALIGGLLYLQWDANPTSVVSSEAAKVQLPSSKEGVHERSDQSPPDSTGVEADQSRTTASSVNVVFGCFYWKKDFYHHRDTPTMDWIVVFLLSFRQFPFSTCDGSGSSMSQNRVVLFLDALSKERLLFELEKRQLMDKMFAKISSQMVKEGVEGEAFLEIVDISPAMFGDVLSQSWAKDVKNGANNFRFALARWWLLQRGRNSRQRSISKVMFSDVTDVAFQADPFCACLGPIAQTSSATMIGPTTIPLVVGTLEAKTFQNEKYNRNWLKCFGANVVTKFSKQKRSISCAGVTFANLPGSLWYIDTMLQLIARPDLVNCSIHVIHAALDQAVHNYILHSTPLHFTAGSAPVTVALADMNGNFRLPKEMLSVRPSSLKTSFACVFHGNFGKLFWGKGNQSQLVVTGDNERALPFAVLHQFSSGRHPQIEAFLRRRFLRNA